MSQQILINNQPLLVSGTQILTPEFHELVEWDHCWDAKDAVTYFGGSDAKWPSATDATRVSMIPDRGHNSDKKPFGRDLGAIGEAVDHYTNPVNTGHPPVPGCKWIASSTRFNGRPCWRSDMMEDLPAGAYVDKVYSYLTIGPHDVNGYSTTLMFNGGDGMSVPYWEFLLGRGDTDLPLVAGLSLGVKDTGAGQLGDGPTVGFTSANEMQFAAWTGNGSGGSVIPTRTITHATGTGNVKNETYAYFGATIAPQGQSNSFVDWSWKHTDGTLRNTRQYFDAFAVNGVPQIPPYRDAFTGLVHTGYISAWGIKMGTPTEAEIDKVRSWAAQHMPAASSLAQE